MKVKWNEIKLSILLNNVLKYYFDTKAFPNRTITLYESLVFLIIIDLFLHDILEVFKAFP